MSYANKERALARMRMRMQEFAVTRCCSHEHTV